MSKTVTNAIILAAGRSSQFFPPLYDKPKGLFFYRNEVLIERQIEQLIEAGVNEIVVVLGYEKERFFYLEQKYGVVLLVNTNWEKESNITSLVKARDYLGDSYICCSDHWYETNPFFEFGKNGQSQRMVTYQNDARRELVVDRDSDDVLLDTRCGDESGCCMVGAAYVTNDWAKKFLEIYDRKKDFLRVKNLLWEQFWAEYCRELVFKAYDAPAGTKEFDSLAEFGDVGVIDNINKQAIAKITELMKCSACDIKNINPINAGLTNISFTFEVNNRKYVYRHPGQSSSNLVDREAECVAQRKAIELGLDYSVIDIDASGWKLSHYIDHIREFNSSNLDDLKNGIASIRRFHESGATCDFCFDLLSEGDRLIKLAFPKKGESIEEFYSFRNDLQKIWHYVELDGWQKVLCHNDIYSVNWIVGENGYCLIDWEYAGMNDPTNDLAVFVVRDGLSDDVREEIFNIYFDGEITLKQRRHAYGVFALSSWYWLAWCLYKDTLGEDGFFMLNCWRGLQKYVPLALEMYKENV